jgi:hypothetical protein
VSHPLTAVIGATTVCIGIVTAYIAWQQWRTNRNQFRLHFFDRRIALYDAVIKLVEGLLQKTTVIPEELHHYITRTREASFLFDDKIQAYCDEVGQKASDLATAHRVMQDTSSPLYSSMVEKHGNLMLWLGVGEQRSRKVA